MISCSCLIPVPEALAEIKLRPSHLILFSWDVALAVTITTQIPHPDSDRHEDELWKGLCPPENIVVTPLMQLNGGV